ncbi:MAG TPA: hypothetical protein VE422_14935 [Terriglobia bacterium]|nr:hypothetical protein [Terriglobia bacterium]
MARHKSHGIVSILCHHFLREADPVLWIDTAGTLLAAAKFCRAWVDHRTAQVGRVLPADAVWQVREAECFRQMPAGKSGKQSASGRCRLASPGGRVLPPDAVWQVREAECFRQMPAGKSGKQSASGGCRLASPGGRVLPADAGRQVREPASHSPAKS